MDKKEHIFTVSELTRNIKSVLEQKFPGVWIEGEISDYKLHPASGHHYFTLKDQTSQLRAVLFRDWAALVRFELKDGMAVICFGRVSVYEARGQYQLYAEKIEPRGIGALQIAFEQLKEKLSKEGLFDPAHKKPIPVLPQRIGVVTSASGAAIRDILSVLRRRFAGIEVIINPTPVQGKEAAARIAEAIDEFNRIGGIDVLIVGRGGGSLEDLWPFNEEIVARAIFRSKIPIISAVGHEIDITIADYVADLRAATPSAAAELVIKEKRELVDELDSCLSRMKSVLFARMEGIDAELRQLAHRLKIRQPSRVVEEYQQRLDDLFGTLGLQMSHFLELRQAQFHSIREKLAALSPLNVLGRGYSVTMTFPDGKIIRAAEAVGKGDRIKTLLAEGVLVSRVEEKKDGGNKI